MSESITLSSGQVIHNFHTLNECSGEYCPVHRPSDHDYLDYPLAFVDGNMVRLIPELEQDSRGLGFVIDPDDYRYNNQDTLILRNSVECLLCGDVLVSHHTHDFKTCTCGKIGVDGGTDYLRRIGTQNYCKDTSVVVSQKEDEERQIEQEMKIDFYGLSCYKKKKGK